MEDAKGTLKLTAETLVHSKSPADDRLVNLGNCYNELYALEMRLGNTAGARNYCLKAQRVLSTAKPKIPQNKKTAGLILANVNTAIKSNGWQRTGK